ncbi:MAG: helix-turn-helix transcriptional regulator [Vicinamibacterales bacterium]
MARSLLTDFELMILLGILRVGDQAYGVTIAREVESTGGRRVVLAAVYAALDRLEANSLVVSTIGDPTPERGGRAKRFFSLTPTGLTAVRETQRALVALWSDIPQLQLKGRRS